jgi:hypothetical protein
MAKGCFTCGSGEWKLGICKCHELIEKDGKTRLVKNCKICGVDLCRHCFKRPDRRILAFGLSMFE